MMLTSANFQGSAEQNPTLREILTSLSFALDLTEGATPGHAIRSSLLAIRIGLEAGVDAGTLSDGYYACLLKDVGCSSNASRMCQIVGGDERMVKAGAKLQDWRSPYKPQPAAVKLLWKEVLPNGTVFERGVRLAKIALTQTKNSAELIGLRCDRGAQIVRKLGLADGVALGVRHLDEHWDGGGYPDGLRGAAIPMLSRLMGIAQHLDAFAGAQGEERAMSTLTARAGRWFDPELARAAEHLHRQGRLWGQCGPDAVTDESRRALRDFDPGSDAPLSEWDIDSVCEAYAEVVDAKSPFTFRHSVRVMEAATEIGRELGLEPARLRMLRRAALLHDVGKLGISNTILEKTSELSADEFKLVKAHPGYGFDILRGISSFQEIALLAREHHERLDGSGYPHNLSGKDLSLESRILATADTYGALSETRPYRQALRPREIVEIMEKHQPQRLDRWSFEALRGLMANDSWFLNQPVLEGSAACALR